jgi:hypothetical protein
MLIETCERLSAQNDEITFLLKGWITNIELIKKLITKKNKSGIYNFTVNPPIFCLLPLEKITTSLREYDAINNIQYFDMKSQLLIPNLRMENIDNLIITNEPIPILPPIDQNESAKKRTKIDTTHTETKIETTNTDINTNSVTSDTTNPSPPPTTTRSGSPILSKSQLLWKTLPPLFRAAVELAINQDQLDAIQYAMLPGLRYIIGPLVKKEK